jgi:hypothetical protein
VLAVYAFSEFFYTVLLQKWSWILAGHFVPGQSVELFAVLTPAPLELFPLLIMEPGPLTVLQ